MSRGKILATIAVPAFDRPEGLKRLLQSIDTTRADVEVVIAEDASPRRWQIRSIVSQAARESDICLRYTENSQNLGFDGNIRNLVRLSKGRFIIFMGDDDFFIPGRLDPYLQFLSSRTDVAYVLRSYEGVTPDGRQEVFRYLPHDVNFEPGQATVSWMFKRSVSLAGFTIDRSKASAFESTAVDGTLLYQVYLMGCVVARFPSCYWGKPFAVAQQSFRSDAMKFGSAPVEQARFQPGQISPAVSVQFTKALLDVATELEAINGPGIREAVTLDLAKYSYPFLSIQRKRGVRVFLQYSLNLQKETGIGITWHYWFYVIALALLGERACDLVIRKMKIIIGHTPRL